MSSRHISSVPKEDVFPRMLYCDSTCSQTLPGFSPALPGALQWNATRRMGDRKRVILCPRVPGSIRAVRAVCNTWVFQTETWFVADVFFELSLATVSCTCKYQFPFTCIEFQVFPYIQTAFYCCKIK
jgi:hypothetical protein